MAGGNLKGKERAAITLTAAGASLSNGSAAAAATADLDARNAGNAEGDFQARFELTCQWATVTGIAKDTVVAELYLVPKVDGANAPDLDLTAGTSALPLACYADDFVAVKAPTAATATRFVTRVLDIAPELYTAYVLNRSGQSISANWSLKLVSAQGQYT